jgi:hypothetical protein
MIVRVLTVAAAFIGAGAAQAQCTGSATFHTCTDQSGNSYTVSHVGSTTLVNGNNARTGSTWNQQSYTFGNTTQTYGHDQRGRSWNETTTPYGSWGTDSNGRSFYAPRAPQLPTYQAPSYSTPSYGTDLDSDPQ